jgi:peptide/nickel transport system substrate-binding protein
MGKQRRWWRLAAVLLTASLVAAACGDDGDSEGSSGTTAAGGATTTAPAPVKGGSITVGGFSNALGLDPTVTAGGGTVGGNELAAMYDVLIRYNNVTEKYEGKTAESMTPNADFTQWTLKLKPNIKFTDGTAYDANAVKFVIERQMKEGNAAPRTQLLSFLTPETSVKVVDPLTVTFTLSKGFSGFPYLLAGPAGFIYSPTQFQKVGDAKAFNINPGPAGAGPFVLKSFRPNEVMEFERNPNYYGGEVFLDGIKFVFIAGPNATFEAIKTGTLQAGFVRDPETVKAAKDAKFNLVEMPAIGGNMALFNSGGAITCAANSPDPRCAGKAAGERVEINTPTKSLTVRRALAAAIDPQVINARVYNGAANPNSAPFANSPWDPKLPGPKADQAEARRLVAQAKTEGWDGKIRVLAGNEPQGTAWAEAVRAQLDAVGIQVTVDTSKPTQPGVVQQVIVQRDFDIATWALGWLDEADVIYLQMVGSFDERAPRYGYSSPDMTKAFELLRVADTQEKRVAAFKAMTEVWNRDVPAHVTTVIPQAMIASPKLNGLVRTGHSITLFDKAWLAK